MRRLFLLRLPVVLCALGAAIGYFRWVHNGRSATVDRANIGSFDVAVVMAVVGLLAWWWGARTKPASDNLSAAADVLARLTAKQWEREARRWGISVPVRTVWSWDEERSLPPDEVISDAVTPTLDAKVVGRIHDELYARLDNGQLVIIGEAGAGKTAGMILLLREALARRSRVASADERTLHPVPVWVTLGGWNPASTSLASYAAESLERAYPALRNPKYGEKVAFRLIDEGRVAFFLDGLDEMPEAAQAAALAAIDDQSVLIRVVLSSRLDGYLRARESGRLTYPAVVRLLPVDVRVAADYLSRGHDRRETRETFRRFGEWLLDNDRSPAAAALRTPLALTLVRSAYADRADPGELTRMDSVEQVMRSIIGQFLVMAFPDPRQRESATFWLGWTARQMGSTRDLMWWDVAAWIEPRFLTLSEIGFFVVVVGPIEGLVGWYIFGPLVGVIGMFSPLLLVPTAFERPWHRRTDFQPVALSPQFPTARQAMLVSAGSVIVAVVASIMGTLGRLVIGPEIFGIHIYPGIVSALSVLLVIAFSLVTVVFTTPSADAPAATPVSLRRTDLRSSALLTGIGLVFGAVFGALVSVLAPGVGAVEAMTVGVLSGAGIGLAFLGVRGSALPVRSAGRWISGSFEQPPGTVSFPRLFEDALRRQVLRQAGSVYQFRHAVLQDHLRDDFLRRRPAGADMAERVALPPENPMSIMGLRTRFHAAIELGDAGDQARAVEALRGLLADQVRVLGRRHEDMYETHVAIAKFQAQLDDGDAAVSAAEELVRYERRLTFGLPNRQALECRAFLALRKFDAGRGSEAVHELRRVCRDARRRLGLADHQTLATLNDFADVLADSDEFAEAVTVMEDYVIGCERLMGQDHPATVTARRRLAYFLANDGRPEVATEIMEKLVPRLVEVFGATGEETFVARYNLACFRGGAGKVTRAVAELEQLASDARAAWGDDSIWVARAKFAAAEQHESAGAFEAAEVLFASIAAGSPFEGPARERLAELRRRSTQANDAGE